jgi:hypothetical protein
MFRGGSIIPAARKLAALVAALVLPSAALLAPSVAYADGGPAWFTNSNLNEGFDALNINNVIEEFSIAYCGVYHRWGSGPFVSPSGPWYSLGGCVLNGLNTSNGKYYGLDVGRNQDGRLEVFAIGTDHALWHNYQTRAASGPWSGWYSLGGYVTGGPTVRSMWPGCQQTGSCQPNMTVTVTGGDNKPWYRQQASPNCCWTNWRPG